MQPTVSLFSEDGIGLRQEFRFVGEESIAQEIWVRNERFVSSIPRRARSARDVEVAWCQSYLAGLPMQCPPVRRTLRAADLFCGSGGLTAGLKLAARTLGLGLEVALACDADIEALEMYQANHGAWLTSGNPVERLVNYHVAGKGDDATWSTWPTLLDPHMTGYLADLDVLVAGPPCQGHSNLNNWTRRNDNRNLLYLTTVAFAVATSAKLVIIENVPDVVSDSHEVVRTACALLVKSGYRIDDHVFSADKFGAAQRRRRHFLIAVRNAPFEFDIGNLSEGLSLRRSLSVRQAISDLTRLSTEAVFDSPASLSAENVRRINWLFKNNKWDLPDKHRPDCHKNGHTYPSVYGRMKWDEPAQTVTTGFLTPGRGRYIHPGLKRTITPHEAARLQSFPDSYAFTLPGRPAPRSLLAKVIGDAVPPLLARAASTVGLALMIGAAQS